MNTERTGLGAAWPRPQMEASAITWRKVRKQLGVPIAGTHELDRLFRTVAAGGALSATLVLEEAHEIEGHGLHVILVGQDHNRVAAHASRSVVPL